MPRDLETVCLKCLEKDRRNRYDSAGELADDLERFLDGRPVAARPVTLAARTGRWCARNPLLTMMVLLLGGLVIALAVAGPLVAVHERRLARRHDLARDRAEKEKQRSELIYMTAEEYYRRAIELLEETVSATPADSKEHRELAAIYNDLAWVIATSPDLEFHVADSAVELARMAIRHRPGVPEYYQTLGLVYYRAGNWQEAIEPLEKSMELEGKPLPLAALLLAMAHARLGNAKEAGRWYETALRVALPVDAPQT